MKKVYFAGSMIVDSLKVIEKFPKSGMLTKIKSETYNVGGCACNTAIDLKTIDSNIDIKVFGKVGNDDKGRYIIDTFNKHSINTDNILIDQDIRTSYTDVLTESDGTRTFFTYGGASDNFDIADINLEKIDCDLFHAGYLLLLERLDSEDDEYGTKMARLLHMVQEKNIKTSIDVVSDTGDRYKRIIIPSLKYCNYLIINEIEAEKITDIPSRNDDNTLNIENIKKSASKLIELGVNDSVAIHCPEYAFLKKKNEDIVMLQSYKVDSKKIKSTVGAGDAFVAGTLYGLINDLDSYEILKIAHASAMFNLFSNSSTGGAVSIKEINDFIKREYKEC